MGVSEYKETAAALREHGVLSKEDADLLRLLAGYRNRLVHFYHEVGQDELYEVCQKHLQDIERLAGAYRDWLKNHPDRLDESL